MQVLAGELTQHTTALALQSLPAQQGFLQQDSWPAHGNACSQA